MGRFPVWIVPMRNWNIFIIMIILHSIYCVWIVPMRNWNYEKTMVAGDRTSWFGSYLWGIETHESLRYLRRSWTGLDRTYEELKHADPVHSNITPIVWIVPMRNWNLESRINSRFRMARLDRTYEELKPIVFVAESRRCRKFGSYLWGIETKPFAPTFCRARQVWIVPMRNWNCQKSRLTMDRSAPFGSYLWGIETSKVCGGCELPIGVWIVPMRNWNKYLLLFLQRNIQFGSYLWGIETFDMTVTNEDPNSRLDRTYEELKLI